MDLSFLSNFYKPSQHEYSHNVVLTVEPSVHPYSDFHHCQVCYHATRRLILIYSYVWLASGQWHHAHS